MDNAKNFAKVTVDGVYDDTVTSVDLITGDGAKLPTVPFNAVWWNATDYPDPADDPFAEILRVTAVATDTLTVSRGDEVPGTPGTGYEHALEGKLYRMAAGPTVAAFAPYNWDADNQTASLQVGDSYVRVDGANGETLIHGEFSADLGTGSVNVRAQEVNGLIVHSGKLGTNQSASATVGVGTISKKIPIYDNEDNLLGYIPVYDAIT